MEFNDVRLIDALLALTRASGTHLHLGCDAVMVVMKDEGAFDGFAPIPTIRCADSVDRGQSAVRDWQTRLQVKHDLLCVEVPFSKAIAELAQRSGVPISVVEPDWPLSLDLRQVSLEHLLRLIAWHNGFIVELDAAGIHLRPGLNR